MSTWSDGYVSDLTYTTGFYREISPAWLSLATILLGQRAPAIDQPFRWCELGCGQGFSALSFAAAYPQGAFYAFDFNPAHIDNARSLAQRAGIANATFAEASFEDLANAPRNTWPQMDYIVLHGIWSWVSSTQRAHLLRFIRDHLAPGGIVYISYNSLTGWASMVPMQRLMRLWGEVHPALPEEAPASAVALLKEIAAADSHFLANNPTVAARIEQMGTLDARYIAHEYLNATWEPIQFDSLARDMAEARCGYIGSATLTDNIDAVAVPPKMAAMIAKTTEPRLREVLRDIGAARPFRRDLFRRGIEQPLPGEQINLMDRVLLTGLGREKETDIQIGTGIGNVSPKPATYAPVMARLAEGPLSFGAMRAMPHLSDHALADALQVLAFVTTGAIAHPTPNPDADAATAAPALALNREIGIRNGQGAAIGYLVSPRLGTAISVDPVETMVLPEFAGGPVADLQGVAARVIALLATTGRAPMADGKPINDPAAAQSAMAATLERFVRERLPLLQRLGIVPEY